MGLPYKSIAVESGIEMLNLQPLDINPLMSKCEIKVFYLGKNRNRSFITKDVATEMAKTLRGCPIVGYFKSEKEDFADHGEQVVLDDEGIHFNVLTKPYGFVAPDANIWFQDFTEQDDFGNEVVRTYLCVEGYLWTGQFEEAKKVFEDGGKPHSMELDPESVQGKWSTDIKDDIEFFIISDAIFSKLCILGDNVEPCFEGSAITEPKTSTRFTVDQSFKNTLFNMMKDLQFALKGELQMPGENVNGTVAAEEQNAGVAPTTEFDAEQGNAEQEQSSLANGNSDDSTSESTSTDFKKEEETEEEKKTEDSEEKESEDDENDEEKKPNSKSTLEEQYETLQANFAKMQEDYEALKTDFESLVQFKSAVEDQKKDEIIAKFYMLSDEDKKDVIENKSKYTCEEIEEKLAVIGFRKGVNFNLDQSNEQDKENVTTFNLNSIDAEGNDLPEWVQAVKDTENEKQF